MDKLFFNGRIMTMDMTCPAAEAALVRDGRFAAVGTLEEVQAAAAADAERIDLQGAAVYPGLMDSHLHILNKAIAAGELELGGERRRAEVLTAVAQRASELPEDSAVEGRGFNQDLWDDRRLVTRRELDEAAPKHPVRLTRICGHMVIANSAAMAQAGIDPKTAVPAGGEVDWEQGVFSENAINLLYPADRDAGVEACAALLYRGMSIAADAGLTAIFSDDFGTGGYSMHTVAAAYRLLEAQGRMPVRVVQQCALPDDASWQEFVDAGFAYGQGSDMYRIGPRKLYSDGSLGARTAWLSVPYADAPDRRGVPIYAQEQLNHLGAQAHAAGMPFIVHAIGDAGAQSVVEAILHARQAVPGTDDLPSGIVHCQITTPELLARIADEHIYVYAQPVFTEYDLHICRDRVGAELEKSSYNWATLLHSGVCISSGSDCPVEPLDPAKNIYCAVTRKDFAHQPEGGWMPEQCLTVAEAIACHTVEAAKAIGRAADMGRIAVGCLADMTVFPEALDAIAPDAILDAQPLMTVVGGMVRRCGHQ